MITYIHKINSVTAYNIKQSFRPVPSKDRSWPTIPLAGHNKFRFSGRNEGQVTAQNRTFLGSASELQAER